MSTAIATIGNGMEPDFITPQQVDLLKHSIMKGANDLELDLFLNLCRAKRLDPLTKQIYAIKTSQGWQSFASIDGLRVIAQRSGEYGGQVGPFWCGNDGEWVDVWLQNDAPAAAKVGVWRKGFVEPTWGVATYASYGKGKDRSPIWQNMPDVMLSKCAESIALRKAFPDDLSGLYVREEFSEEARVTATDEPMTIPPNQTVRARLNVNRVQRGVPSSAGFPDAVDAETGEARALIPGVIDVEMGEIEQPNAIETMEQVKNHIRELAAAAEWSKDDLALAAKELRLPSWVKMTYQDARDLRNHIIDRIADAEAEAEPAIDPEMMRLIDAEIVVDAEARADQYTR